MTQRRAVYAASVVLFVFVCGLPSSLPSSSGLAAASSPSALFVSGAPASAHGQQQAALFEEDDEIADLLADDDEFEGAAPVVATKAKKPAKGKGKGKKKPKQNADAAIEHDPNEPTLQNVLNEPASFFQPIGLFEYLGLATVLLYLVNYFFGRSTNGKVAALFEKNFAEVFEEQLAFIGTDPSASVSSDDQPLKLSKESEYQYRLYGSGRRFISGCLVTLDLKRRQDLFSSFLALFDVVQSEDTMTLDFALDESEVENFAFAVVRKKAAKKWQKEHDPETMMTVSKAPVKAGMENYAILNELAELEPELLTERVVKALARPAVAYHFVSAYVSDQVTLPWTQTKKVLSVVVKLPSDWSLGADSPVETLQLVVKLAFHLVDVCATIQLTPQAKARSEAHRKKLLDATAAATARERAEAQARRKAEQRERDLQIMANDPKSELAKELLRKEEARKAKQAKKAQGRNVKVMR
jgi:hypothetical protein